MNYADFLRSHSPSQTGTRKVVSMDEAIQYANAELATYTTEDLIQFYLDRRVDEILVQGIPGSEGEG